MILHSIEYFVQAQFDEVSNVFSNNPSGPTFFDDSKHFRPEVTVIIERLFSYEGLGNMAIDAVINRDLPLIQGIVLIFALLFTMVNLVVDMAYAALNPRLRHA